MINNKKDISFYRGEEKSLTAFHVSGDYTGYEVTFAAKVSKDNSAVRLFSKANTMAGGGNNEIAVNKIGNNTEIIVSLDYADTSGLDAKTYYYDLVITDNNKRLIPYYGDFKIIPSVQFTNDPVSRPSEVYVNQIYDRKVVMAITENGNGTTKANLYESVALSASRVGLGVFEIEADYAIFDNDNDIELRLYENSNSNVMAKFTPVKQSGNKLQVNVYDEFSRMVIDLPFLIEIKRFKQ